MNYLNDLIAETTEPNLYVTSFTCKIDTENKILHYLNCGHNPSVIIRNGKAIELTEGDTVIGMFPGADLSIREVDLKSGDILTLYTDGVIEAENIKEKQFSLERLEKLIIENSDSDPEIIKDKIMKEMRTFTGSENFVDDITFILIKVS